MQIGSDRTGGAKATSPFTQRRSLATITLTLHEQYYGDVQEVGRPWPSPRRGATLDLTINLSANGCTDVPTDANCS
ncbi:hypothetical protein ACFVJW_17390 [Streptomyces libani]|uniref:hypothetical protein n=1 Tax=Streptomyces nigrescens TaxID=1920 RepID=UPI00362D5940